MAEGRPAYPAEPLVPVAWAAVWGVVAVGLNTQYVPRLASSITSACVPSLATCSSFALGMPEQVFTRRVAPWPRRSDTGWISGLALVPSVGAGVSALLEQAALVLIDVAADKAAADPIDGGVGAEIEACCCRAPPCDGAGGGGLGDDVRSFVACGSSVGGVAVGGLGGTDSLVWGEAVAGFGVGGALVDVGAACRCGGKVLMCDDAN